MSDYATFQVGGVSYPLTTTGSATLLRASDPILFFMLDYFASILETHIGQRFLMECTTAKVDIDRVVAYKTPIDPAPYLTSNQFKFPLLAIYRKNETYAGKTVAFRNTITDFAVEYILPPLTAAQSERLLPILPSVARVLDDRIQRGADPSYTPPGGTVDGRVWSAVFAGLQDITLVDGRFGSYPGAQDLDFPAWVGTVRASERTQPTGDFSSFDAVDHETDLVTTGDTTITDFADFASDVIPPGPATAGED